MVGILEDSGIKVVGAHEIVPDLLAGDGADDAAPAAQGRPARHRCGAAPPRWRSARSTSARRAVAIGGRVDRARRHRGHRRPARTGHGTCAAHGRLAGRKRGVLVKCAKPGQELRADLPSIGPATVEARPRGRPCRHRRRGRTVAGARLCARWSNAPTRSASSSSACDGSNGVVTDGAPAEDRHRRRRGIRRPARRRPRARRCRRADRPRCRAGRRRRPSPAGAGPEAAVRRRRNRADGLDAPSSRDLPRLIDAHRPDGACDRRGEARLPGHHRQPGFHAARRQEGARRRSRDPDRPLCLPERLGVAAGQGGRR